MTSAGRVCSGADEEQRERRSADAWCAERLGRTARRSHEPTAWLPPEELSLRRWIRTYVRPWCTWLACENDKGDYSKHTASGVCRVAWRLLHLAIDRTSPTLDLHQRPKITRTQPPSSPPQSSPAPPPTPSSPSRAPQAPARPLNPPPSPPAHTPPPAAPP